MNGLGYVSQVALVEVGWVFRRCYGVEREKTKGIIDSIYEPPISTPRFFGRAQSSKRMGQPAFFAPLSAEDNFSTARCVYGQLLLATSA